MRKLVVAVAALAAVLASPGLARSGGGLPEPRIGDGAGLAGAAAQRTAQCGLPDATPWWIDYVDGTVPFRSELARPGTIVATTGGPIPASLRSAGAQTIYWEMNLPRYVGTPDAPADPAGVAAAADGLAAAAALSSGCPTPLIALNELLGPVSATPWPDGTTQYRADVLAFLQELAAKGALPFLLVPSNPPADPGQAAWWQQVAQVADVVREVYFQAPTIVQQGPVVGSRTLRTRLRAAVQSLTSLGVPAARTGLMLGFQSGGVYGRDGVQPREAWLEYVKLNVLAARQVASELQVPSIWDWGWAAYSAAAQDPDKPAAACVALWARDQTLCDGAGAGGPAFDASLTEGQIDPTAWCVFGTTRVTPAQLQAVAAYEGGSLARAGTLELERQAQAAVPVTRAQVLAAEREVVQTRFHGERALYLRTLAQAHLTVGIARGILVDELRGLPTIDAQQALLGQTTCAGDVLPAPGSLRAAARFPFLKLHA